MALEARDFQFSPGALHAPGERSFAIAFANQDAAVPHNVTITTSGGVSRFSGKIVNGVAKVSYDVPALAAGTYRIGCIVHPTMSATLTVD